LQSWHLIAPKPEVPQHQDQPVTWVLLSYRSAWPRWDCHWQWLRLRTPAPQRHLKVILVLEHQQPCSISRTSDCYLHYGAFGALAYLCHRSAGLGRDLRCQHLVVHIVDHLYRCINMFGWV